MIAKIGRGSNLFGALAYNQQKIDNENGKILMMNKMIETKDGNYTVAQLAKSFEPYLIANRNTEKTTLHISLNPDPKDNVSDKDFVKMAQEYMNEMGYGEQPFVVFKHTDISRAHIHIVTVGVDEEGRKISDKFEKRKSMKICRELERKYKLSSASDKEVTQNKEVFSPVSYQTGNIKSQMASVIRNISKYYQFQSIGEYNALLSLYNITSEKVDTVESGISKNGLLYFVLNDKSEKVSQPFKASLFGKDAGLKALGVHFLKSKEKLRDSLDRETLKEAVTLAMKNYPEESEFKTKLQNMGVSTVVRRNATGRIYGITFIDHHSRSVWNGSRLGKEFSANAFQQFWSGGVNVSSGNNEDEKKVKNQNDSEILPVEKPHELFNFFSGNSDYGVEGFGSILPGIQGDDYEELDFENRMKKKKKNRKRFRG